MVRAHRLASGLAARDLLLLLLAAALLRAEGYELSQEVPPEGVIRSWITLLVDSVSRGGFAAPQTRVTCLITTVRTPTEGAVPLTEGTLARRYAAVFEGLAARL